MTITADRLVQEIRDIISEISEINTQRTDLSQTIQFLTMKKDRLKKILDTHIETGEDICVLKLNQEAVESAPHYDFHKQVWGAVPAVYPAVDRYLNTGLYQGVQLTNTPPAPYNPLKKVSGV